MMNVLNLFGKLLRDERRDAAGGEGSTIIEDQDVILRFISNPANTLLVSFPRTGSHWLRMLMELYFKRPTLKLVFYHPEITDYLAYHTHDLDLDMEHPTVLYLYRDPVHTIYSLMTYHKEPLSDTARVVHWSDLYGRHLDKWLYHERFTTKKTVLRYEGLKRDMTTEFAKVTKHFGVELDLQRLAQASAGTTKENVKRKTTHDQQVINLEKGYEEQRAKFSQRYSQIIWDTLLNNRPHLKGSFLD